METAKEMTYGITVEYGNEQVGELTVTHHSIIGNIATPFLQIITKDKEMIIIPMSEIKTIKVAKEYVLMVENQAKADAAKKKLTR